MIMKIASLLEATTTNIERRICTTSTTSSTNNRFRVVEAFHAREKRADNETPAAIAERPSTYDYVVQGHDVPKLEIALFADVQHAEEAGVAHLRVAPRLHEGQVLVELHFAVTVPVHLREELVCQTPYLLRRSFVVGTRVLVQFFHLDWT